MFPVFIKMLQFALALAPDLADVVSILCQEERRQSDLQSFDLCIHRYWYLYICTYILYIHTYTSSYGGLGGRGLLEDVK